MLVFTLIFPSGNVVSGAFDPYVKYDCLSYHSEAEFKDICENSSTGLEFLLNLGSYYSGQLADNCDDDDVLKNRFFDKREYLSDEERTEGYLVITADKGLASSYNHNVIKVAEKRIENDETNLLFVVGEVDRR